MLNFFQTVIEYIKLFYELVVNSVRSLALLLQVVLSAATLPQSLITYVPSFLATSILIVLSISVLKLILGRDNSA